MQDLFADKAGISDSFRGFSAQAASRFYESWDKLKSAPKTRGGDAILSVFEQHKDRIVHCASRLSHFASVCQRDTGDFYFTHGDAGGNFFIGHGKHYIVDWDEVMYAPLERDAWPSIATTCSFSISMSSWSVSLFGM